MTCPAYEASVPGSVSPSRVCNTRAAGTVTQSVACAPSTLSTTEILGCSWPFSLTEITATSGRRVFIQWLFVEVSLPWWLTCRTSTPTVESRIGVGPAIRASASGVSRSSCELDGERPVHELSFDTMSKPSRSPDQMNSKPP